MASVVPPPNLSDHQLFVLEMAGAIVASRSRALQAAELEVLAETGYLLTRFGREAPIARHHWVVVHRAVAADLAGELQDVAA